MKKIKFILLTLATGLIINNNIITKVNAQQVLGTGEQPNAYPWVKEKTINRQPVRTPMLEKLTCFGPKQSGESSI